MTSEPTDHRSDRTLRSRAAHTLPQSALMAHKVALSRKSARRDGATEDLAELIRTTNGDLAHTRTELFFFLFAVAFIFATTLGISDRDLLVGRNIDLPILNLPIELSAFLYGSLILLLSIHFALLLRFYALRQKCNDIRERIESLSRADGAGAESFRLRISSSFLTQWILGAEEEKLYRLLSSFVYVICLVLLPLLTMVFIVVRSLPLHQEFLTTFQNLLLSFDVWFLIYFHRGAHVRLRSAGGFAATAFVVFSLVFSVPDSGADKIGRSIWSANVPYGVDSSQRTAFAPTAYFLESRISEATGRPLFGLSRNLVVPDLSIVRVGVFKPNSEEIPNRSGHVRSEPKAGVTLRGRDLRYAILDRSTLDGADFTVADLTGTSLVGTSLVGAKFGCAVSYNDGGIRDECTVLTGANLSEADLRKSDWTRPYGSHGPSLHDVDFQRSNLDGANLYNLDLSRANFRLASLVGANLSATNLVGANMVRADMDGVNLYGANLTLASLTYASLRKANLDSSVLKAVNLNYANLEFADMSDADLTGASLAHASVWAAQPPVKAALAWGDLTDLKVRPLSISQLSDVETKIQGAGAVKTGTEGDTSKNVVLSYEKTWTEWSQVMARSGDDAEYHGAVSRLLSKLACDDADVASALVWDFLKLRWTDWETGNSSIEDKEKSSISVPVDPALARMGAREVEDGRGQWYDLYDPYIYEERAFPLSVDWIDLTPLLEAISRDECKTWTLDVDALRDLRQANQEMLDARLADGSD